MPLYRFTQAQYADAVENGLMRFGSLEYYRQRELLDGDTFVGDQFEGRRVATVRDLVVTPGSAVAQELERSGHLRIAGGAEIQFQHVTFENTISAYAQCLAEGDINALEPTFTAQGYDACVEMPDMKTYMELLSSGWIVDADRTLNLSPSRRHFRRFGHAPVRYVDLPEAFEDSPNSMADPFLKRTRYSDQAEYRVLLVPSSNTAVTGNFVTIQVPLVRPLRRVF